MARSKGTANGTSQMGMVRAALGELGADAKPQAIHDFVVENFGKELPKSIISNYKSNLKKREGIGNGRSRSAAVGDSVRLEDLEAVRGLVQRLGAEHVQRLAALLG